ncbi:hypothetical protein Mapa_003645 [Marchantia paleacea]|nr:hypothetical protein Mapa_003645 [Marchantia paleacea]
MAFRQSAIFAVLFLAVSLHQDTEAATHIVGGASGPGWTFQATDLTFYDTWASKGTFAVGDVLVFNYNSTEHNVLEVTAGDLSACTVPANAIATNNTSNGSLTISTAGTHYYICGFPLHCVNGMKMTLTTAGSSAASPPAPANSTSNKSDASIKSPLFTFNALVGIILAVLSITNL